MTVSKIQERNIQIPEKIEYLSFIRVKSVDKVNVSDEQFYDFTVDKVHNYLAGKQSFVYVHNTVLHLYMRERLSSAEACRKLVKNVISNHRLPYITVTPVFSVCEKHGYLAGEHEYCPKCDEELLLQNKNLVE